MWVEKAEHKVYERGPDAVRTAVVIETVADPLGIYKEYVIFLFSSLLFFLLLSLVCGCECSPLRAIVPPLLSRTPSNMQHVDCLLKRG